MAKFCGICNLGYDLRGTGPVLPTESCALDHFDRRSVLATVRLSGHAIVDWQYDIADSVFSCSRGVDCRDWLHSIQARKDARDICVRSSH